jgi:hypothetical protein
VETQVQEQLRGGSVMHTKESKRKRKRTKKENEKEKETGKRPGITDSEYGVKKEDPLKAAKYSELRGSRN